MRGKAGRGAPAPAWPALAVLATAVAMIAASPAPAAGAAGLEARLHVFVDDRGQAAVSLLLPTAPPAQTPLEAALGEAVGCDLTDLQTSEDEDGWWLSARCWAPMPRRGLLVEVTLRPGALAQAVQASGASGVVLEVMHPTAGFETHRGWESVPAYDPAQRLLIWRGSGPDGLPEALQIRFGPSRAGLLARLGVPLLILTLPLGLAWWLRRRALGSGVSDQAVLWFRFIKSFNMLVLATWLGWIAALWFADTSKLIGFLLWPVAPPEALWVTVALYFVPPGAVHAVLTQIAYPVLRGVRGMEVGRGELARQAWWTMAALVLPLLLGVAGLDEWTRGAARQAVGLWGAAGVMFLLASRRRGRAMYLEPHALTEGELRDRIFALAARAKVTLKQIYVLPAYRARLANALAAVGNVVLLTDYLLQNLSRREVDAVVAHELAHLKRRHPQLLVALATGMIMIPLAWRGGWHGFVVPLAPALAILAVLLVSRRFERRADALAAELTGDPEALITALVKLASLNVLPLHWGKLDESLLTHPSARRRALALAQRCNLTAARVDELLAGSHQAEDRYPLPVAVTAAGPVFSTRFKHDVAVLNTWAQILVITFTPAVAAWLASMTGGSRGLWYLGGAVVTLGCSLALANLLPPLGQRRLLPRLAERVSSEGFREAARRGTMVGLSPSPGPRLYESNLTWDMGFLVTDGDRLGYVGEQARLVLRRSQVTAVRPGPSHPGWWTTGSVVLDWHDREAGRSGTFQLRPAAVGSLSAERSEARELLARLEAWWRGEEAGAAPLSELDALSLPTFGEVTSQAPRESLRPAGCLLLLAVVELVAGGLAVLLGLGVWGGVFVFVVAAVTLVLLVLPTLVYREVAPGPARTGPRT